jgi:hypothetical protein
VPQYWLKPLGVAQPHAPVPNAWTVDADLDEFPLITGPATQRQPPQMGRGDLVLFHAVIHVCLFAAAEILDNPQWKKHSVWGLRWPWAYPCRVHTWVSVVERGPRTTEIAPKKAIGRIQSGSDFAKLSQNEYQRLLDALLAQPTVQRRTP